MAKRKKTGRIKTNLLLVAVALIVIIGVMLNFHFVVGDNVGFMVIRKIHYGPQHTFVNMDNAGILTVADILAARFLYDPLIHIE